MSTLQAIILGIVQGITEFLPVSSSGHLVLLQKIWHISGDELLFITCLHLGTLIAVVWVLRRDVVRLLRNPLSWTGRMILVALIPTVVVGGLFEEAFENLFQSAITVGFEFVITGAVLWWMDGVTGMRKKEEDVTPLDALWIGALQGAAILPALSRSGLTIAAGLWRGLDRETATRFSFLLSIPAILGATVVELDDIVQSATKFTAGYWTPIVVGTLAAVVAGYVSVKGTMWLIKQAKMKYFAVYVWILAAFVFCDQLVFHRWFPPLF
jgi:undecaprenyl-diphosphatase